MIEIDFQSIIQRMAAVSQEQPTKKGVLVNPRDSWMVDTTLLAKGCRDVEYLRTKVGGALLALEIMEATNKLVVQENTK